MVDKKKKKDRVITPEEQQRSRQDAGQAYIQEREKLASKANVSSKEAAQQLAAQEPETVQSKAEREISEEAARQQERERQVTDVVGQIKGESPELQAPEPFKPQPLIEKKEGIKGYIESRQEFFRDAFENRGLTFKQAVKEYYTGGPERLQAQKALAVTYEGYDTIISAVRGKSPLKVEQAEENFNILKNIIENDIARVREDPTFYSEAAQRLYNARYKLSELDSEIKFRGITDSKWLIDEGEFYRTKTEFQLTEMDRLDQELQLALREAATRQLFGRPEIGPVQEQPPLTQ